MDAADRAWDGPVVPPRSPSEPSDHFDGEHFFNPGTPPPASPVSRGPGRRLVAILRWQLRQRRAPWVVPPPDGPYAPLPERVAPGTVAAAFVGHSTFVLRFAGGTVLTDPIFSDRCSPLSFAGPKRVRPPGIAFAALPPIDLVLVSHSHYDHMDLPTLRRLQARDRPAVVTMRGNRRTLAGLGIEATELDWWEETRVGPFRIVATPARHFAARTPWDTNRSLWGGFAIVEDGEAPVLFAGDSGAGPHWREIGERIGAPALALLPIGAYLPREMMRRVHVDPAEAVDAHLALGARRSVGMHFGTFQLAAEAIDAPPRDLADARQARGVPADAFVTQGFGETLIHPIGLGNG